MSRIDHGGGSAQQAVAGAWQAAGTGNGQTQGAIPGQELAALPGPRPKPGSPEDLRMPGMAAATAHRGRDRRPPGTGAKGLRGRHP